ncbi:MAG: hypothetical protein MUD12_06610 [Spirochaetes bacterium]|jgi:hypothetical protein|nr:hypothetical protein [Spirochaetota bacterium]
MTGVIIGTNEEMINDHPWGFSEKASEKIMKKGFTRRIFNFSGFIRYSSRMVLSTPRLISATFFNRVPYSLQEKILLTTTSVNKCIICARFASEMAFSEGVAKEEVLSLLNMDLNGTASCNEDEIAALLFARDYAETNGSVNPGPVKRLYESYPWDRADAVAALTMKSHYYNLMGNTFSAFVSRLKGMKAEGSYLLFEIFFVLMTSPIVLPSLLYIKLKKNDFRFMD